MTTFDTDSGFRLVCQPADNLIRTEQEFQPTLMLNVGGTTYAAMYEPWSD